MEFGNRRDSPTCNRDAIRFTLDVYPQLREYNYDSIEISCDLIQRSTSKRCVLSAIEEIESRRYDGPCEYLVPSSVLQKIQGGDVRTHLHFKTRQDKTTAPAAAAVGSVIQMTRKTFSFSGSSA